MQVDDKDVNCSNKSYLEYNNNRSSLEDKSCCADNDSAVLLNAFQESYNSRRLTPLLKYELKYLIQARRITQGMDEMKVEFLDPAVVKLTEAEQEQVERRRHQNRMAARRFRQKRKMSEEVLVQTIQELEEQNKQLQKEAQLLRKEKHLLMETVTDHLLHCPIFSQVSFEVLSLASVP